MTKALSYASNRSSTRLPLAFEYEEAGAGEVEIEILYCGVCHSDLHHVENNWGNGVYPCMPGHEPVGRVTKAGADVTKQEPGDIVAVGCMIDTVISSVLRV